MLINSFIPVSDRSKVIIYADDMTLIHHVSDSETDFSQNELENILDWAKENKLFINPKKSYVMHINPHNYLILPLVLCNVFMTVSTSIKLLGVIFCLI